MAAHSPIGASSYYRWKECPGSVRLSKDAPPRQSVYADEGTRAHEVASAILQCKPSPTLDEESMEAIRVYTGFVFSLLNKDTQVWIEEQFDLSEYYPGLFGTCDAIVHDPNLQKLFVIDYKHGAGVAVTATENLQLMYYGVGALHSRQIPVRTVELVIVQPRCNDGSGGIKRWVTDPVRLTEFIDDLKIDAAETAKPDAPLKPGDHCRFCPAQPTCPALQQKSMELAKKAFAPVDFYEPKKLGEVLKMLPAMESWVKAVREFAYNEAQAGRMPEGFKLVDKRVTRKWKDMVTPEVLAQEFGFKPPEVMENKMLSPAQIEKKIKSAFPKRPNDARSADLQDNLLSHFEKFWDKESSGQTLVQIGDERDAVDTKPKFDAIPE